MKFQMTRDINGYNGYGLKFTDENQSTTLVQNVEQGVAVPTSQENWIAIFTYSAGANVFVTTSGAATVPGAAFDKTVSQYNPVARQVKGGQTLSFITPDADGAYISVSFYSL